MYSTYSARECSRNIDSSALEPARLQHDRPAARVIAQHYSSATFALRFRCRKEKFGALSTKNVIISVCSHFF
jgi:hypothetical protein